MEIVPAQKTAVDAAQELESVICFAQGCAEIAWKLVSDYSPGVNAGASTGVT